MAAYDASDNFESYGLGTLNGANGGSGWSGAWSVTGAPAVTVVSSPTNTGTRAVFMESNNGGGSSECIRNITNSITSGIMGASMYAGTLPTTTANGFYLVLRDGTNNEVYVTFNSNGFDLIGDSTVNVASGMVAATWYDVQIEIDQANNRFRARVDGGTWSSWVTAIGGSFTEIDNVRWTTGDGTAGNPNYHFDDIVAAPVDLTISVSDALTITESRSVVWIPQPSTSTSHLRIESFTSSTTWVPSGVVGTVGVYCWAAGGGGSTAVGSGGGGAFAFDNVSVTNGNSYTITVGTSAANTSGGNSSFDSTVVAIGGQSGTAGAAGGTAGASTGSTKFSGGNGSLGTGTRAGGGGAGDQGNGGNGSGASAGTAGAVTGGQGASTTVGSVGKALGAGGRSDDTTQGTGGRGQVTLVYTVDRTAGFPGIRGFSASRRTTSSTSHTISIPTNSAGDMLMVFFTTDGDNTFTVPDGWNILNQSKDAAVNVSSAVIWRISTGADTLTVTSSVSEISSHTSYSITDYRNNSTPQVATATGSSGSGNPPSLTPTTGAKPYIWFAGHTTDWGLTTATVSSYPTGYDTFYVPGATTSSAAVASGFKLSNAASEDPGTFGNTDNWVDFTVSVEGIAQITGTETVAVTESMTAQVVSLVDGPNMFFKGSPKVIG